MAQAATTFTQWTPLFKGIEYCTGTNTPGTGFPNLQVMYALRVDLNDPDLEFFTTPRITNYLANSRETAGLTMSDFLSRHKLQVAINANFFDPSGYTLPAGTAMKVHGLAISRGTVVSVQESALYSSAVLFTTNNQATIIHTNWPSTNLAGIYNAVSGTYPLVVHGVNVGFQYEGLSDQVHQVNPRTAYGLTPDRRHLIILAIDGRQPDYSDGALDYETGKWLLLLGVYEGVNMDGGGSTTLVMESSTGKPVDLNHSNALPEYGQERTVGSHFGIYAKPVVGFINEVVATPDDTTAVITWTTTGLASTQVRYGLSTNFVDSSTLIAGPTTNHLAQLSGLTPSGVYYYQVLSTAGTNQYASAVFTFTTTNYVSTNQVVSLGATWRYTVANLDLVNWMASGYDDSNWTGSGPGILWTDARGRGPSAGIPQPSTQLPLNPNNSGYPYFTYYLRTHFNYAGPLAGASLIFGAYVDDGAVFYLNGVELQRLRMDAPPKVIANATLATGFPCTGNADCADEFTISGDSAHLVSGDNVLAVEVHNFANLSPDVTFGTALTVSVPIQRNPTLTIGATSSRIMISWDRAGFKLQQATSAQGPWLDVPGPIISSPYETTITQTKRYYRLGK